MFSLHFAYFKLFYIFIPLLLIALFCRLKLYKSSTYTYPLVGLIKSRFATSLRPKRVLFFLRFLVLTGLILLVVRPQWVDPSSKISVEGVDIVLVMDVSQSMVLFDDLTDQRSRMEIAKQEAARFIDKRESDQIGLVIFGDDALTRTPLTLDKKILKEVVGGLHAGILGQQFTFLGSGLALSVARLKHSKAKSRIIILLTDGLPSSNDKISPDIALGMAKELGVRVYCIGIGNPGKGGYFKNRLGQVLQVRGENIDFKLLEKISAQSGGSSFSAQNAKELKRIYEAIDSLERTKIESNIFHNYYEACDKIFWLVLIFFFLELFLRYWLWRGIACF